jgi:hypothetical protein
VSTVVNISSVAAELTSAVLIALTTDYCVLTRFSERHRLMRGHCHLGYDAADVVSGVAVAVAAALGALVLLPFSIIASIGAGYCIGAIMCVVSALVVRVVRLRAIFSTQLLL